MLGAMRWVLHRPALVLLAAGCGRAQYDSVDADGGDGGVSDARLDTRDGEGGADGARDVETTPCTNGIRDGIETGIDCGGTCGECTYCEVCAETPDCVAGTCVEGRCRYAADVMIDAREQCGSAEVFFTAAPGMPAGRYRVEVIESGIAFGSGAEFGFTYNLAALCPALGTTTLHSAPGVVFTTVQDVYLNMVAYAESVTWAGGNLLCHLVPDSNCGDNRGALRFRATQLCE